MEARECHKACLQVYHGIHQSFIAAAVGRTMGGKFSTATTTTTTHPPAGSPREDCQSTLEAGEGVQKGWNEGGPQGIVGGNGATSHGPTATTTATASSSPAHGGGGKTRTSL